MKIKRICAVLLCGLLLLCMLPADLPITVKAASTQVSLLDISAIKDKGGEIKEAYQTPRTLKQVNGYCDLLQNGVMGWKQNKLEVETMGGSDVLLFRPWYYDTCCPAFGVQFTQSVNAADCDLLVLEIYIDFNLANLPYDTCYGGVRLFSTDATGAKDEGVMVPNQLTPRQWIRWTIKKSDLVKLADQNGVLSGLQFGSAICLPLCGHKNDGTFYQVSAPWTAGGAKLYIKSVTAVMNSSYVPPTEPETQPTETTVPPAEPSATGAPDGDTNTGAATDRNGFSSWILPCAIGVIVVAGIIVAVLVVNRKRKS